LTIIVVKFVVAILNDIKLVTYYLKKQLRFTTVTAKQSNFNR